MRYRLLCRSRTRYVPTRVEHRKQAVRLGLGDTLAILWPYIRDNFLEQIKSIWFIVVYLALFQVLVLGLPIVYAAMIGAAGLLRFEAGRRDGLELEAVSNLPLAPRL